MLKHAALMLLRGTGGGSMEDLHRIKSPPVPISSPRTISWHHCCHIATKCQEQDSLLQ